MDRNAVASAEEAARRAITLVCISLPHLSGLAHSVRVVADDRVGIAGVFPSGRLLIHPDRFLEFTDAERVFVLAHELLHLALHTHERAGGADRDTFNVAHDLIINDILETELGMAPPAGGVRRPSARFLSAEALMLEPSLPALTPPDTALGAAISAALKRRGDELAPRLQASPNDVLDDALEANWFPDETPEARTAATEQTHREATKALSLQRVQISAQVAAQTVVEHRPDTRLRKWADAYESAYVDALDVTYRPPWQLALHRWLDTVTAPVRSYSRASRRGDRIDVVLPGRSRDAQTLSIVLDTSGSMSDAIAHALGSIMAFGRGANIESIRVVQCDTAVTADDVVAIDDLTTYRIAGFGGSDMTPAMEHLARDPEVTAVVVITDGDITYPDHTMPYHVLWVVYETYWSRRRFTPHYGQVIHADTVG